MRGFWNKQTMEHGHSTGVSSYMSKTTKLKLTLPHNSLSARVAIIIVSATFQLINK